MHNVYDKNKHRICNAFCVPIIREKARFVIIYATPLIIDL